MTTDVREIADLGPDDRVAFFERDAGIESVRGDVREIVDRVREEGDVAIREFTSEFDGVEVGNLEITDECERAYDELDPDLREAIETAAANVKEFHEAQIPEDWRREFSNGRELGRRFRPIDRVGVYVPGGEAAYPSSAIMGVVPAVVAGVEHVSVVTPPADELNPATLAAIHIAGADAVYSVGGAQAIAALAYGSESITRVQKVVGPGNKWVTAAKAAVRGDVEIDFLAGPSEIVVVADETADPTLVAAELVAQAEHDPNASVVAVTDDADTATAIADAVGEQANASEREDVIRQALENDASGVLLARSMSEAILFTEEYAPEHLSIIADDDESLLERIDSAGSVFLGPETPVAAGDYASGTNHVLPTNGGARVTGGLSVETFLRSTTVQRLSSDGLNELGETITTLADAEGLDAHANSVRVRLDRSGAETVDDS
ncbi:histidinol dehydrogenase [Natrialba magadii ATCC 43099]|uniref:Histidinol dehydrogenase n=1 Tax=Natrialba magadii (strain ATCC 43099 / DSM 3394 / CCM 3739 / CIP 104546 / IAM 13178 / JCM 8861 / NBRC 102185 / NCIMB 2190 / MS3) TaxID=547559 RepID=D3SVQ4_NATMM|nr:histidinol dehydrogenase [Natrialba magadii]ADD03623.1 histidinol dehydrogenase [Natrialba magadii ATCC 43099]ELY29042.1 bifunctional histidinal dehydrogenase/ histidinol dehydrogenase [Natrialba magadii ATCC 43099]